MKEALYYKKLKENKVQCNLCPHFCLIKNNEFGKCKIRTNNEGILYTLSYRELCKNSIIYLCLYHLIFLR